MKSRISKGPRSSSDEKRGTDGTDVWYGVSSKVERARIEESVKTIANIVVPRKVGKFECYADIVSKPGIKDVQRNIGRIDESIMEAEREILRKGQVTYNHIN